MEPVSLFYEKRAQLLLKNLRARHFDACYCPNRTSALAAALRMIPHDALVGWGGVSLTGELVNIDGKGNRVAAIVFGPREIIVIAGMNKVVDTLDEAVRRARTIAAPKNEQRFLGKTPCAQTGCCADCHGEECICNQILITRNCRPAARIHVILVGEELGF